MLLGEGVGGVEGGNGWERVKGLWFGLDDG